MLNTKGLFNLGGKVALVTGGGAGLGREFCDVLAEFGADVVCCDLRGDRAQETSGIIGRHGHQTLAVKVDVSEYDQVQAVFRRVEETFGHLDVLVNNAGITTRSTVIEEVEIAEWQKLLNVNLSSVFYCMKEGLRLMARQKRGTVINITSILGLYGSDPGIFSKAAYAASKAGIIGLTREGAAEYGRYGIRINCIAPGWFPGTKLEEDAGIRQAGFAEKEFLQNLAERTPMRRVGSPHELKGLLVYLSSDASSYVTGQVIPVDGGWTCI